VEFAYNPLKQLTEMRDWLGTTTIELDPLGRTTKTTDHDGNQVGYSYNSLGQKEKLTYPDGSEVAYEYNASGRLEAVIAGISYASAITSQADATTPTSATSNITRYAYDSSGRISQRILPDKTTTDYHFNQMGALSSLTHYNSETVLDQFHYSYDPVGNITQIEKQRTGIEADNGVFEYVYDPLNRLTQATQATSQKSYSYDNLGNRIASQLGDIETSYTFNARNQLVKTIEGISAYSGAGGNESPTETHYHYDKRGNLTQIMEGGQLKTSYTYDATNMMTAAHNPTKGSAEYAYDGFKNRVKKLESLHNPQQSNHDATPPDPAREIRYVLDMTRPYDNLLMTQGQGQGQNQQGQSLQTQRFIWGNSLLSASMATSYGNHDATHNPITSMPSEVYYLHDNLGSPIRLLSSDAQNTNAMVYDEFGVQEVFSVQALHENQLQTQRQEHGQSCPTASPASPTSPTSPHSMIENPFGFTGYQLDDITGMHYAQARYYSSTTGRFVAEDPIRDQFNWYGYCGANPVSAVDPTGLFATTVVGFAGELLFPSDGDGGSGGGGGGGGQITTREEETEIKRPGGVATPKVPPLLPPPGPHLPPPPQRLGPRAGTSGNYFIFHCSDFPNQATWKENQFFGGDANVQVTLINNVDEFISEWNRMAASDDIVNGIYIFTHGGPHAIWFGCDNALSVDGYNRDRNRSDLHVASEVLNTLTIDGDVRLMSCNTGHLDMYRNGTAGTNFAAILSSLVEGGSVWGFDGAMSFGGNFGAANITGNFEPRLSTTWSQGTFRTFRDRYGDESRNPLGWLQFTNGRMNRQCDN